MLGFVDQPCLFPTCYVCNIQIKSKLYSVKSIYHFTALSVAAPKYCTLGQKIFLSKIYTATLPWDILKIFWTSDINTFKASWKFRTLDQKRRDWDVLNLANDSHRTSVLTRRKLRDLTWMTSNIEISFNILVSLSIILNRLFMKKGFILLQNMWEVREPAIILPIYNWADFFRDIDNIGCLEPFLPL